MREYPWDHLRPTDSAPGFGVPSMQEGTPWLQGHYLVETGRHTFKIDAAAQSYTGSCSPSGNH